MKNFVILFCLFIHSSLFGQERNVPTKYYFLDSPDSVAYMLKKETYEPPYTRMQGDPVVQLYLQSIDDQETKGNKNTLLIKNNIVYSAGLVANGGVEFRLGNKLSMELTGSYTKWNPFGIDRFDHFMVQPELRFWLKEEMRGHFFGAHLLYGQFNIRQTSLLGLDVSHRYQGALMGAGLTYGYRFDISTRWKLEGFIGFGYTRLDYDEFYQPDDCMCSKLIAYRLEYYWLATKMGLNLVFVLF